MLLLIKFSFAKKIIDSFVVLVKSINVGPVEENRKTNDFKELPLHLVHPTLALEIICNPEYLVNSSRNHPRKLRRLRILVSAYCPRSIKLTGTPSIVNDFPDPVCP